jgi:hypothetical protein
MAENQRGDDHFVDHFLEIICRFRPLFGPLLAIAVVFVLLGLLSFPFNSPGSASRLLLYLILPMNAVVLVSTVGLIYLCGERK